jgi:hypothetical protein
LTPRRDPRDLSTWSAWVKTMRGIRILCVVNSKMQSELITEGLATSANVFCDRRLRILKISQIRQRLEYWNAADEN